MDMKSPIKRFDASIGYTCSYTPCIHFDEEVNGELCYAEEVISLLEEKDETIQWLYDIIHNLVNPSLRESPKNYLKEAENNIDKALEICEGLHASTNKPE